jgi:NADH-quinone oxidoreductase subunit A
VSEYLVLLIFFAVAVAIAIAVPNLALLTNRIVKIDRSNLEKFEPYECGIPKTHALNRKYFAIFYILALVFILFDLETAFLFPWAVFFKEIGILGVIEAFVFVVILLVGFVYAIFKGALKWD